jgi:sporulation protein YlmC with PRC-barrel domain
MFGAHEQLLGKPVLNGCGALLGRVVDVVGERDGEVREIVVRQLDGLKDWIVEGVHIKHVADQVVLKGPREGYHIAPLAAPEIAR